MATKGDNEKFCSDCGQIISLKAEICPKCGVRQMAPPSPWDALPASLVQSAPRSVNKTTAGVLAVLLGGLGAHKFYLGQAIQGLLYLFLCWTFVPAIIGFVEGLNFLTMSDKVFASRYLGQ